MRRWTQAPNYFQNLLANGRFPDGVLFFLCMTSNPKNTAVGNLRVRRVTNKNINQGPVGKTDDLQQFVSVWNTSGARLDFSIWSTSVTGATAMAATAIEEAGLNDRAGHFYTTKSSAQDSAEGKPDRKLRPAPKDGNANLYLVLTVLSGGKVGVRFLRLASCGSTSETVEKALRNTAALDPWKVEAPGLKAYLIDFGKCLLQVFRTGQS